MQSEVVESNTIDTPLGQMIAIANEKALYLLEFVDRPGLEREIERLRKRVKAAIVPGRTASIDSIEKELELYFEGTLKNFQTPIELLGSPFQKQEWLNLLKIPFGETRSYKEMAETMKNPKAVRAVGSANGANQLAIIIPCHRVINTSGELGGYGGGLARKKWLLTHEEKNGKN